jgi:hypothetical protein
MYSFTHIINDIDDHIVPMGVWKFNNKIDTNDILLLFRSFRRMELSEGSAVLVRATLTV